MMRRFTDSRTDAGRYGFVADRSYAVTDRMVDQRSFHRILTFVLLWAWMTSGCFDDSESRSSGGTTLERSRERAGSVSTRISRVSLAVRAWSGETPFFVCCRERGFDPYIQEFSIRQLTRIRELLEECDCDGWRRAARYRGRCPLRVFHLQDGATTGGAVDNGAGAIVLIRVAETLRRHSLEHRVRLVLFDLEEVGAVGSRAFLEDERVDGVAAMVNVDVIAGDGILMYGPTVHEETSWSTGVSASCARAAIVCMSFPQYPPSDDRTFQAAGSPTFARDVRTTTSHQLWLILNARASPDSELVSCPISCKSFTPPRTPSIASIQGR